MYKPKPDLLAGVLVFTAACNSETPKSENSATPPSPPTGMAMPADPQCFLEARNRDTTRVRLEFDGDSVRGAMEWLPWEKDRATGTLSGIRTSTGELDLRYRYTIEGSRQTETKLMKLDGDVLRIKVGELEDSANDNNLRYRDASRAAYSEKLNAVACPPNHES